ncbi:DUF1405 domain-containing protein [Halosimplex sp. J119]
MEWPLAGDGRSEAIPRRWARYYLENAPSLVWLIFANVAGIFVGVYFYLETLPEVETLAWPLYMDSPVATLLMALALATLLPNLGRRLDAAPTNLVLAYLQTIAFVWLVETGLWTALALNLHVTLYFPDTWRYFGVLITHLLFIPEAYLLPHFGRTTPGALGLALALALVNDVLDYGFGLHPPLRYEAGVVLIAGSVATSLLAVGLAAHAFERLPADRGPAADGRSAADP